LSVGQSYSPLTRQSMEVQDTPHFDPLKYPRAQTSARDVNLSVVAHREVLLCGASILRLHPNPSV
jgi:hypothetical protein